jgi:hypothetical protein
MGLNVSDAFRMLLTRNARGKVLPFELLIPNKETIAAMKAVRRGDLTSVNNVNELLESLKERVSYFYDFERWCRIGNTHQYFRIEGFISLKPYPLTANKPHHMLTAAV